MSAGGVNKPSLRALDDAFFHRGVLLRRAQPGVDVVHREREPRKRRGPGREGLGRPCLLPGDVALRHWPFFNRPERSTRDAVEDVEKTGLARQGDGVDALAVVADGHQLRRRHVVVIPQVVMDRLEVPEPLSRARIERDQAVREEVLAEPIATIEVVGRRSGRHVHDPALVVDREGAPVVGAADVLVRLLRPRVVAELSRPRNCMELPDLPAGDHVVGADVSRWGDEGFAGGGPKDQQVLPDFARAVVVPAHLVAPRGDRCADRRSRRCRRSESSVRCAHRSAWRKLLIENSSRRSLPSSLCQ